MLVDDEPHILEALQHHIGWAGLNLRVIGTAVSGTEAYKLCRELRPDLVMTDVYMPGMSGLELVQQLRAELPDIRIVILSGFEEFENARQAMRYGVDHFLLKPAGVKEIEAVLGEIMQDMDVAEQKKRLEERYKREVDRMLPYLREKLFYELLTTRYQQDELPNERLEYLEIEKPRRIVAVSLRITRPAFLTKLRERDWQLLRFGAGNIAEEMLRDELSGWPEIQGFVIDYSENVLVLLLFQREEADEPLYRAAEALSRKTTEKIMTYLKIEAIAGIGSIRSGICEVIDSYLESREALEAAEFQGAARVYSYREWSQLQSSADSYTPLLKMWNDVLPGKDMDKVEGKWAAIHAELQAKTQTTLTELQTFGVGLWSSMILFWNEQFPLTPPPYTMSQFLQDIHTRYTHNEFVKWLDELVNMWIQGCIKEFMGRKSNRLVEKIKEYVEMNYDQEISFAAISKELYVHPKYLSQLFKRVTGENFVNYLNRFRIRKAVEYLQSGQHMVYEVSEMVGFNNPAYFSQVFKIVTGKSPSEYMR